MSTHTGPADGGDANDDVEALVDDLDEEEAGPEWHDLNPELKRRYTAAVNALEEAKNAGDAVRVRRLQHQVDRIGTEFWELNKGLVLATSRRFRAAVGSDEEYAGAGALGCWEAFLRWDPDRGVKFSTFSRQYINGRILRSVRSTEFKDLTQSEFGLRDKVRKEQARLSHALDRLPTVAELATALEVPVAKVEKVLGPRDVSLDTPVGDGEGTLVDIVADRAEPLDISRDAVHLQILFEDLSDLEYWVIQERSGMLGDQVQSLIEVADTIGIGREVARRAETRARTRAAAIQLRHGLGREPDPSEISAVTGQPAELVPQFMSSSWRDLQARLHRHRSALEAARAAADQVAEASAHAALDRLGREFFVEAAELVADIGGRFVDADGEPIGIVSAARLVWASLEDWDPSVETFPAWARKFVERHARRTRNLVEQEPLPPATVWRLVSRTRVR